MTRTSVPLGLSTVEAAIREHHALVYRVAFRMVKNSADAEDVAQGVFLLLLRQLDGYTSANSSRAWLARVTMNHAVSWMRSEDRRRRREKSWASEAKRILQGSENMDEDALKEAIELLPEELRIPVVLHYQEGFKYREIADVCKCPEGTVARRLSTAKQRIRKHLARGGIALAAAGLETTLHGGEPILVPAGLAESLAKVTAAEAARMGAASTGAAGSLRALGLSSAKSAACKCGIALGLAALLTVGAWSVVETTVERGAASRSGAVTAVGPTAFHGPTGRSPNWAAVRARKRGVQESSGAVASTSDSNGSDDPSSDPGNDRGPRGPLVRGWVRDKSGAPIAGARVGFASAQGFELQGETVETDAEGRYELDWSAVSGESTSKLFQSSLGLLGEVTTQDAASRADQLAFEFVAEKGPQGTRVVEQEATLWNKALYEKQVEQVLTAKQDELAEARMALAAEEHLSAVRSLLDRQDWAVAHTEALEAQKRALVVVATEQMTQAEAFRNTFFKIDSARQLTAQACQSCHAERSGETGVEPAEGEVAPCAARGQSVRVRVDADGFETQVSDPIALRETEEVELSFEMRAAVPLSGTVLSDRGAPIAGAEVAVAASASAGAPSSSVSSVLTDEAGRFRFTSLEKGLHVLHAGFEGFLAEEILTAPGQDIVFRLKRAGSVEARVMAQETGEPLEGYRVEIHDSIGIAASAVTDASGVVVLSGLTAGQGLLNTYRDGSSSQYSRASTQVTVAAGEQAIARLEVASRGDVVGAVSGLGYDGASGRFLVETVPLSSIRRSGGERKASKVLEDGTFSIKNVPPGRYAVVLCRLLEGDASEALSEQELEIAPGVDSTRVEFSLDAMTVAALRVRVVDEAGEPLGGASVALEEPASRSTARERRSDDEGRAELAGRPGRYWLNVRLDGFTAEQRQVRLSESGAGTEQIVLSRAAQRQGPDATLESLFATECAMSFLRPVRLASLCELARAAGLADIVLSHELEASEAVNRVLSSKQGTRPAHEALAEMLKSAGLRWEASGRTIVVSLPSLPAP